MINTVSIYDYLLKSNMHMYTRRHFIYLKDKSTVINNIASVQKKTYIYRYTLSRYANDEYIIWINTKK